MKISYIISMVCLSSMVSADINLFSTGQQADIHYDVASANRLTRGSVIHPPKNPTFPSPEKSNRPWGNNGWNQ